MLFAQETEEEEIYNLYIAWEKFNPYTDWLPTHAELQQFIKDGYAIVNKKDGKITGIHLLSISGKKCYLRLLMDTSGGGLKLIKEMLNLSYAKGVVSSVGWVNSQNESARSLYLFIGAQMDGLKDYTYIKKTIE